MRFYYQFSFVSGSQIHQHRVLEASWEVLKVSWGCLGTSWGPLGTSWSVLEPSWNVLGRLGTSWSRLRSVLDASWGCLRRSDWLRRANKGPARAAREGVGGGGLERRIGGLERRIGGKEARRRPLHALRPEASADYLH